MKDQFVTYDIAKKLKELGFRDVCFGVYLNDKLQIIQNGICENTSTETRSKRIAAPLWQQAIDWLMGKGIHFDVNESNGLYSFCMKWHNGIAFLEQPVKGGKYNEAREAAILKALELISK